MEKLIQDVSLGKNLQNLRKQKGFTQEGLCAKLSLVGRPMSQANYAHIERGARNIFVSDLIAIKQILGVEYEEIFQGLEPVWKTERFTKE